MAIDFMAAVYVIVLSAHKRFCELLSKEERNHSNSIQRVPMDQILTLPELKVKITETLNVINCRNLIIALVKLL